MLKREWGAESNGMLQLLFIPSKTATLVPEFAVEDLPLCRTAALVPEFAVKDLALRQNTLIIYTETVINDVYDYDGQRYPWMNGA